jgi:23S rRNA pseudouridine1911/1915/1917 synthase
VRLDLALIRAHPGLSRRKARDVIEKGQVSVNGETALEPGRAVDDDSDLVWNPNRKARPRARLSLPLLYRDSDVVVVDKPPGLLSVPTSPDARSEDSALARVEAFARRLNPKRPFVGPVHRIDRDTSGALAFALTPAARRTLRSLFRSHSIERRYSALVLGTPERESGIVDVPIHDAYRGGRRRVARRGEPSHDALTRWTLVERLHGAALLDVELSTGRQHQIRLHLAHIELPVLGDAVYGRLGAPRTPVSVKRQMLHARWLEFASPETGRQIRVESPLPEDFQRALAALRSKRGTG